MKYTVDNKVFELDPGLRFGIIIGRGLNVTESTEADTQALRRAEAELREKVAPEGVRDVPNIARYREVMTKAGINPNRFPPSVEGMFKRIVKGGSLPAINALVDLCNVVSITRQLSLGGHDLQDIDADLMVRFSGPEDIFLPFGEAEYEPIDPDELVFVSGHKVQTRKWVWRQSELGKVTTASTDIFFQLAGNEDRSLELALADIEKLVVERFQGTYKTFIVTPDQPQIEF